jgi:hypothetical protein
MRYLQSREDSRTDVVHGVKKKLERTITYKLGDTVEEKDDKAPTTIVRRTAGGPF